MLTQLNIVFEITPEDLYKKIINKYISKYIENPPKF